ncbi:unnamed protein product [Pieris macdunnoughi]|uniref:Carboxylic ester hydrolase n=1 Tax=Pieris macdunnoughi TaxID=345717 RepID=A0A821LPP6_9NEOP|nr:unnamed protein product [Pieris macdunnoughi]
MSLCVRNILFNSTKVQRCFITRYSSKTNIMKREPLVITKNGELRGCIKKLLDGTEYYSFKGIPYAQPPVGKLRFKAPLPAKPWEGVYDALKHGPISPQFDAQTRQVKEGSEDCLYLNVYTKSIETSTKGPVMVFIHGGGFISGSGNTDLYGPEFLLQHNVVLVTINYRLEVLGFLNLDIAEVPGNAGMKDQVLALRWIQENINDFGGDSNNVTIFGESAGAASVTYHMVSPMSRNLFHKVIAQSGVCTANWAQGVDGKNRAFRLCKLLGNETRDPNEALTFLQSVPAIDLVGKTFKTITSDERHRGLPMHFCPNIEKKYGHNEVFLPEDPEQAFLNCNSVNVPLMIGYNSKEGLILISTESKKIEYRNKNPSSFVPREIYNIVNDDKLKEIGQRIKEFYFGGQDITMEDAEKICDLQSDLYFTYPIHYFIELYAKNTLPVYMYSFNYDTDLNFFKNWMGASDIKGAAHVDELFYIFCCALNRDYYEENEILRSIINNVTRLWTDFAKNGNPVSSSAINWQPYTIKNKEYLNIDKSMAFGTYVDQKRIEFWKKMYKEAGLHRTRSNL